MRRVLHRLLPVFRTFIGLGLLVYLGASGTIDWSALSGLARNWPLSLGSLCLVCGATAVGAWRLCLLMRPHGLRLALLPALKLTLIGLFFNTALPGATGGDVVKIYYATEGNRGRRLEIVMVLLFDRIVGVFALLCLPLLLAVFFGSVVASLPLVRALLWAAGSGVVLVGVGALVGVGGYASRSRVMAGICRKLPRGEYLERVLDTFQVYRTHLGTLGAAVGLSLLVHCSMAVATLLVVSVTNPLGFDWSMALLIPFGFAANALPVTPGGLGVGEAAFDTLFHLAGFTGGAVALLGWRVMITLIGLPGLLCYLFAKKHAVAPQLMTPSP